MQIQTMHELWPNTFDSTRFRVARIAAIPIPIPVLESIPIPIFSIPIPAGIGPIPILFDSDSGIADPYGLRNLFLLLQVLIRN